MTPDQYNQRVLDELTAIRKNTESILGMMRVRGSSGSPAANGRSNGGERIAEDRDLDGQYGDPTIKFDPKEKYWQGASYAGYKYSECPPEYLDAMAKYLDACAFMKRKDGDEKNAGYKEKDAARARGWAQRNRARGGARQYSQTSESGGYAPPPGGYADDHEIAGAIDDEIPF